MSIRHFSSIDGVFDFVLGYVNVEKGQATEFKLDRMYWMASQLGDPHLGRLTVHVAGSKGKGSVATLIAKTLEASELRTGLYTSPHILSWKERITESGIEMPDEFLLKAAEEVYSLVEGRTQDDFPGNELPTYFELTTLIAFCAFRIAGFDAQVIEVGLGGRLDSTNIVSPDVCIITPIELEHTQFLGSTIPLIAAEKAGIIKRGVPICTIQPKEEALKVILKKAEDMGASCLVVGRDISVSDIKVNVQGTCCKLSATDTTPPSLLRLLQGTSIEISTPLIGSIYAGNMAVSALALSQLDIDLKTEHILKGFASSSMLARFEIVSQSPFVVLDGAHTPESIRNILATFLELSKVPRILLFGCAHDKKHEEIAKILSPYFNEIIITRPGTFKQSEPAIVFESFQKQMSNNILTDCYLIEDTNSAITKALSDAKEKNACVLVTGSFYLCAEFKKSRLCFE